MRTELFIKAEQTQILSQKMILSNEILQMGVQELCEKLGEIFLENPVVDLNQPSPEEERMAKYQWLESLNSKNRDTYMHESRDEEEGNDDWKFKQNDEESLQDYLWSQVSLKELSGKDEEIVSYLVACGHTKIGMIGCRELNAQGVESLDTRLHCFQDALIRKGLYHPEYTKYGAYYPMYGYELLKELYQEGNLPTALFVANDSMAAGSYRAAYELGLHIPEDISIVGFNDIPAAKYMIPPLTTVRLYMEFMGEYAVKLLEERILHGREICVKVSVPTQLCIRDSVKKIK